MHPRANNLVAKVERLALRGVAGRSTNRVTHAFTLIEMLVVLIIIGILAALTLPHIRGNQESVAINSACRQLVDDFSFARQRAMSIRGTVAVVFLSPEILDESVFDNFSLTSYNASEIAEINRLQGGVLTHYALYQYRTVGEQPGSVSGHYITDWKALPEKTFLDPGNFDRRLGSTGALFYGSAKFPFPFSKSRQIDVLPYLAFDWSGRCIEVERAESGVGTPKPPPSDVRVARGAILYSRNTDGTVNDLSFDPQQVPPYNSTNNQIHVDFLTGRAQRIELQLQ